ncbi:hypothetical protein SS50377_24497 [Spironucleus salmonicida]|uniref:Uncharacterized protein n=1 Tax=Spironucleus salmonicida TaxID=348837 RepID=A0A9P8LUJ9_9EUKA|nr:hypothetical protein SS50377_24497 [Spironucleus salmonicida]
MKDLTPYLNSLIQHENFYPLPQKPLSNYLQNSSLFGPPNPENCSIRPLNPTHALCHLPAIRPTKENFSTESQQILTKIQLLNNKQTKIFVKKATFKPQEHKRAIIFSSESEHSD